MLLSSRYRRTDARILQLVVALGALWPSPSAAAPPIEPAPSERLDIPTPAPDSVEPGPNADAIHYEGAPVHQGAKIPLGAELHIEGFQDSTSCELDVGSGKWRLDIESQSVKLPSEEVPPGPATISICARTDDDVCVPIKTFAVELIEPESALQPVAENRVHQTGRDPIYMTLQKRKLASLYWSLGGKLPFWFPVGLFGTNFQPINTGQGIPIAALPAGLAFGAKIKLGPDFFLGASLFCNWAIQPLTGSSTWALPYPGKGENIVPSATMGGGSGQFPFGEVGNTITIAALATGGLVDVGGYFMVGGAASVDFAHGRPAFTPIFVIGPGQRFLEFLNGERQPYQNPQTKREEE